MGEFCGEAGGMEDPPKVVVMGDPGGPVPTGEADLPCWLASL